jgi:hypothetical protein
MRMTLPTNDDFAKSELSTGELETVSGGLFLADGGRGGGHGHHPHKPPLVDLAAILRITGGFGLLNFGFI